MRGLAFLLPLALAACVGAEEIPDSERVDGVIEGPMPLQVGGATVGVQEFSDWPRMISTVDAKGRSQVVESGTAETVIISGAADFVNAVAALGQYCGRKIDVAGFDTQFVYQDPETGDYWFDGFCG
jgi:hypothetical protein